MKMRFVNYYRVSTQKQGLDGNGIQAQKDAVQRYLATLDCEVIGSYEEVESGGRDDRPELKKAMDLAKREKAILCIAKLDRLSRNAAFLLQLQNAKIDFICCDMPNADKFSVGILALMAQREKELISQRTRAGLMVAKRRGARLGNPNAKVAWKAAQTAIQARKTAFNREALAAIREIQNTGVKTLVKTAFYMNKRGEKTARGGEWTATAVKRVLDAARNDYGRTL